MNYGYIRAAAASPEIRAADCAFNSRGIIAMMKEAGGAGADILAFPELCITGYTCGDLFLQDSLLSEAKSALSHIADASAGASLLTIVGLPYAYNGKLYNCAAVIYEGRVLGLVPKAYLRDYAGFNESRCFTPGNHLGSGKPLSTRALFQFSDMTDMILGVEIGEDLWAVIPPSAYHVKAGASVVANLSADNEAAGKDAYRCSLVANQSAKGICGYIYAGSGEGESTTDLVFGAHNIIAENGKILAESPRFTNNIIYADIDLSLLNAERRRNNNFVPDAPGYEIIAVIRPQREREFKNLRRFIDPAPFVPSDPETLAKRCEEVLTLQALGLKKRLKHLNMKNVILGISGGLDSTLALLVCIRALIMLNQPLSGIHCIIMPCFGTTGRTYKNAVKLARLSGGALRVIPINASVLRHFSDIGHDPEMHDLTYENAQARERTQVLMDIAPQEGGLVVGTGDLSELALGFATYNGDHMSMYGVNASVPKTLIRRLIAYEAGRCGSDELKGVLYDILDTPVSPELLPSEDGDISQKTEDILGPYEAHDFFLYYLIRFGFSPEKILFLAQAAFKDKYTADELNNWLIIFYKRFFANQFKRSCLPDGPKVGSVALSPRGGWNMPSDAPADLWIRNLDLE